MQVQRHSAQTLTRITMKRVQGKFVARKRETGFTVEQSEVTVSAWAAVTQSKARTHSNTHADTIKQTECNAFALSIYFTCLIAQLYFGAYSDLYSSFNVI